MSDELCVKAFMITSLSGCGVDRAITHLRKLSRRCSMHFASYQTKKYTLNLIAKDILPLQLPEKIAFTVGASGRSSVASDRFVRIIIDDDITLENDYAGSIPVFYSSRSGFTISNIEPCVVLATNTSENDVAIENLYGYLRYLHYIWDETLYRHINQVLPDSEYSFDFNGISRSYRGSLKSSESLVSASDQKVASALFELNDDLVFNAVKSYDKVVLPLSSGYDSRMILAILEHRPELTERFECYTYGAIGSVEVEAARQLASILGCDWKYIDLPCKFLKIRTLLKIYSIFGSSLHMHGMYQLEFFEQLKEMTVFDVDTCLVSGFMTGVPAGQHNGLLNIDSNSSLTSAMGKFSQSKVWGASELAQTSLYKARDYKDLTEQRFRQAYEQFEGQDYQRSVVFDVWTRQRNFISYYPKTLEWGVDTVSPHMSAEYQNFFLGLSKNHLHNRKSVELMFKYHYPKTARTISNSNGLKSITSLSETLRYSAARVLRLINMNKLLPQRYRHTKFDFNTPALNNAGEVGVYPLLTQGGLSSVLAQLVSPADIKRLYVSALNGDVLAYQKLTAIQSVEWSLQQL